MIDPTFVSDSNPTPQLSHALLLWSNNNSPAYASLNPVKAGVIGHQPKALTSKQLLQFSQQMIAPLAASILKNRSVEITPERVLLNDPVNDLTVWWRPSRPTPQFFSCEELGTIQGVCNMPSLVFAQHERSLSVCAIAGNQRPTNDTPVFHVPMFNTYDNGSVCLGGVSLSSIEKWTDMDQNESDFLRGINTHPNGNHIKTRYPTGIFALWRDLVKDPKLAWNDNWLNPMKLDLQNWIKAGIK